MKKSVNKTNKPSLVLRREHIRVLTQADLEKAVGGDRPTTSETCQAVTVKVDGTCG